MGEWIRTEDRLPKDHERVLCLGVMGGMFIGYCVHAVRIFDQSKDPIAVEWCANGRYCPKVIAWTPIPPVPEGLMK